MLTHFSQTCLRVAQRLGILSTSWATCAGTSRMWYLPTGLLVASLRAAGYNRPYCMDNGLYPRKVFSSPLPEHSWRKHHWVREQGLLLGAWIHERSIFDDGRRILWSLNQVGDACRELLQRLYASSVPRRQSWKKRHSRSCGGPQDV